MLLGEVAVCQSFLFVCWLTEKSVESLILTTSKPMPLSTAALKGLPCCHTVILPD
jgi:hypothetical protein